MVLIRARSFLSSRIFFNPPVWPIFIWNFRRNNCSIASRCCSTSSWGFKFLIFSTSISVSFPGNKLGLDGQLVRGEPHCLDGIGVAHTFHLEQNLSRTNHGDPMIGSTLAFTHTGFSRFLGNRLVWEETQPHFTATLYETSHGDAAGFNLTVSDVATLHRLQPEISEGEFGAAPGLPGHAPALLLAVLNFFWHQHKFSSQLSSCQLPVLISSRAFYRQLATDNRL